MSDPEVPEHTLEEDTAVLDRKVSALRWVSALVPIAVFVVLVLLIPIITDSRDNSKVVRDGNAAQACRSALNAKIVAPAQDAYDQERNKSLTLILHGLAAAARGDDAALGTMATAVDQQADSIEQSATDLTAARTEYAKLAKQSATDPHGFLEDCRAKGLTKDAD